MHLVGFIIRIYFSNLFGGPRLGGGGGGGEIKGRWNFTTTVIKNR